MSDTPLTDPKAIDMQLSDAELDPLWMIPIEDCRELERRLNACVEALEKARCYIPTRMASAHNDINTAIAAARRPLGNDGHHSRPEAQP